MFLTHLDQEGHDSPAILIENATAANRAVNIPEFVNVPPDGLLKIDVPAAEFYRLFDRAWTLAEKGQYEASIAEWKRALEISPNDAKAHNNLGRALAGKGEFAEAVQHWQQAVAINPSYAEAHNNLGVAAVRNARYNEAVAHFRKALDIYPTNAELHNNLASALAGRGKFNEAVAHWQKALEINPRYAEAYNDFGNGLFSKGRLDEAIVQWQKSLEAKPDFVPAGYNLGRALARKGRLEEAIAQWQKAIANGRQPEIMDAIAAAYAEIGRFRDAVEVAKQALILATQENKWQLAETLKARIAVYQAGNPLREH
jgi:tetratricopeptide (TPR) repeat protein